MTTLPKDSDNNPIPALALNPNGAHLITVTSATSVKNTNGFDNGTRIISLYATSPMFIQFGDINIDATTSDHFLPAGLYYDFAIGGGKTIHTPYLSAIAVGDSGIIYISEKK